MPESSFSVERFRGKGYKFTPNINPIKKNNFCRHIFTDETGDVHEAIRLNVLNDRHREDIIAFHFSRHYAEINYSHQKDEPQFYMVGRDCPWDFEYVMHDSTTFFLEICRVADKKLLKAIRMENDCTILLQNRKLRGHEILKIERHFPGTIPFDIVAKINSKTDKNKIYDLGDKDRVPELFVRPAMNPRIDLEREIRSAIQKKLDKRHMGKDRTILILDNLTTHNDPDEFIDIANRLSRFLESSPFPSICVYTGYYSDDDGFNCEFSLLPIKLSPQEAKVMNEHCD